MTKAIREILIVVLFMVACSFFGTKLANNGSERRIIQAISGYSLSMEYLVSEQCVLPLQNQIQK